LNKANLQCGILGVGCSTFSIAYLTVFVGGPLWAFWRGVGVLGSLGARGWGQTGDSLQARRQIVISELLEDHVVDI